MILLKPAAHSHTNIYVHTPRDPLMGDQQCLLSQGNCFQVAQINAATFWSPHGGVRGRYHTQSQLTLSRWAAAPSRWCSTRHTWKGIPSPPWHPSCRLCQWLPYLPQTEQYWLFCTRQLRSLWGQKARPGSFIMSKLTATTQRHLLHYLDEGTPLQERKGVINAQFFSGHFPKSCWPAVAGFPVKYTDATWNRAVQISKTSPCPIPFPLRRSCFILKGYRFFEMLLSYERNFGGTGMAREVIAGTISTANDLNPTLKKQNWKLSPTHVFVHLTIKSVYSPLSPPCSHDCFFYIISSVTISSPPSPVAPSFEWFHLFPEETISHLPSACVQGQLFHMAWQSTALCQQLGLGPEHTVLSLTCHRHTRHHPQGSAWPWDTQQGINHTGMAKSLD